MGVLGDRTPHTLVSVRLSQKAASICFLHPQSFKGKMRKSMDEYAAHHKCTRPQPAVSPVPVLPRVGRLSQTGRLGHSFAMCLFLSSLTSAMTKLGSCKAW